MEEIEKALEVINDLLKVYTPETLEQNDAYNRAMNFIEKHKTNLKPRSCGVVSGK